MAKTFGVMLDCSRNAVMSVEKVNEFVDRISSFGYNLLMLYTEDTYQVENQPYFGYMRGAYTEEELRCIDQHCKEKCVELVPCIQTLAHLNCIFRWGHYNEIRDCNDILCVGLDETYKLIEDMFISLRHSFSTNRVHIGMDEAHMVGLGKYLEINGYDNRFSILQKHLERVKQIAKKYGFEPIMWSDMFFRLANNGNYYPENPSISLDAINAAKGVEQVYWDYYHKDYDYYSKMMKEHKCFDGQSWFAGGVWTWCGFAPYYTQTINTMLPAMNAAKDNDVDNIFLTMWGDNGKECSYFSQLPALYYLRKYYDGERNLQKIKDNFNKLTGEDFDNFVQLEEINFTKSKDKNAIDNPCKYTLYNDPFLGYYDTACITGYGDSLVKYSKLYKKYAKQSKNYPYVFECLSNLCSLLSLKAELGKQIRKAYDAKDNEQLLNLVGVIKRAARRLQIFHDSFEKLWMIDNKPQGFEIHDIRLGGVLMRLKTCRRRLIKYINGELDTLPELDEKILDYYGTGLTEGFDEKQVNCNEYIKNSSISVF